MGAKDVIKLREKLDFTQEQLATSLGLGGKTIVYRWESNQRKPGEPIRRLICYLNDLPKNEALKLIQKIKSYGK